MNKAILGTDIFSEITKGVNQTVAANATVYRAAFGRYTISAVITSVIGKRDKAILATLANTVRQSTPISLIEKKPDLADRAWTSSFAL